MRAILQRVLSASVEVEGKKVAEIGPGMTILVGVHRSDTEREVAWMADRLAGIRIFSDEEGKMNLSIKQAYAIPEILAVSNFTVYGDSLKGRRPSFLDSAPFEEGQTKFNLLLDELRKLDIRVAAGVFGADMKVSILNDGPVTLVIDSPLAP